MITVYVDGFFVSPIDASVLISLEEKGIEYQTARALLRDGQGVPPSLATQATIARVPTLQHGDFFLTESLAIIDYLEQLYPAPPLFSANPRTRARCKQVMAFLRFDIHALRDERQWWTVVYPAPGLPPLSPRAARDASELISIATTFVPQLGDEFSIAHADLALALMRLANNGHPMPDALTAFIAATCQRPSVRTYLDHSRPPNPPLRFTVG